MPRRSSLCLEFANISDVRGAEFFDSISGLPCCFFKRYSYGTQTAKLA